MNIRPYLLALGLAPLMACTSAQLTTADATATQVCADIAGTEGLLGPLNLDPTVAVTEAYLGDACSAEKLVATSVPFLQQFAANLKATAAQVKAAK